MRLDNRSDPLIIDKVRAGSEFGEIGMTLCPGRHDIYAIFGDRGRDLNSDLKVINDWEARALVSLIEAKEMEIYGVADLPGKVAALGIEYVHLPVVDMDIPDAAFDILWLDSGKKLRSYLRSGQRIVLHCLAGLGRTGMIAAKLLIELGIEQDEAIRMVRTARPGTIQTMFQELYVKQCQQLTANE